MDNIFINTKELPGNGVDDDQNGYIDDVKGWDFYNDDNIVFDCAKDIHGTHVAGIIGAIENSKININSDEDWYVLEASKAGKLTVTLKNIPTSCDYDIAIYKSDGLYLGGASKYGNSNEKASVLINSPDKYYIRVYSYTGSDPNSKYVLKAWEYNIINYWLLKWRRLV